MKSRRPTGHRHSLESVVAAIREMVTEPPLEDLYRRRRREYQQICSAMDAIGDTEIALAAFFTGPAKGRSFGTNYLRLYGFLQALSLQQDAVDHLCEALGVARPELKNKRYALARVRELRNDVLHQKKRGTSKRPRFFGLTRIELRGRTFEAYSFSQRGTFRGRRKFDCAKLLRTQNRALNAILSRARAFVESQLPPGHETPQQRERRLKAASSRRRGSDGEIALRLEGGVPWLASPRPS